MGEELATENKPVPRMKILEVMKRAHFLKLNGKVIMKIDLSNLGHPEHVARVTNYLVEIVEKMPRQSAVGLVDFRGMQVSDEIKQEVIRLEKITYPYFRAGALIATDAQSRELADAFMSSMGKTMLPIFEEEEPAKNWLLTR